MYYEDHEGRKDSEQLYTRVSLLPPPVCKYMLLVIHPEIY